MRYYLLTSTGVFLVELPLFADVDRSYLRWKRCGQFIIIFA